MIIHIFSPREMTGSDVQKINERCENLQIFEKFELFSAA
jgi:hypothetical protein